MSDTGMDTRPTVPPVALESASIQSPRAPEVTASATPERSDKEQLCRRLQDTLTDFFKFSGKRAGVISDTDQEAGSLTGSLHEVASLGEETSGKLNEANGDPKVDEIKTLVRQASGIVENDLLISEFMYGEKGEVQRSVGTIRGLDANWREQGELEELIGRLKEIDNNPDEGVRNQGIDRVRAEIARVIEAIRFQGVRMCNRTYDFRLESSNDTSVVSGKMDDSLVRLPSIRDRLGEDRYSMIKANVGRMLEFTHLFKERLDKRATIPQEFQLLAEEAVRTGLTVEEILETIKAAK
jgi:hypothetical protein